MQFNDVTTPTNRIVGIAAVIRQPSTLRNSSPPTAIGHSESRDSSTSHHQQIGLSVELTSPASHNCCSDPDNVRQRKVTSATAAVVRPIQIEKFNRDLRLLTAATASCSNSTRCQCSASNLHDMLSCYYPNMSQEEAKNRLRRCQVGTFLLRDSSQRPTYPFSLTMMTSRGVTSVRIAYEEPWYILDTDHPAMTSSASKSKASGGSRTLRDNCVIGLLESLMTLSSSTTSHSSDVKPRSNRDKCVLVESSGRADVELLVTTPLIGRVLPLKILCCIAINKYKLTIDDNTLLLYTHSI